MRWFCAGGTRPDAKVNLYIVPDDVRGPNVEDQRSTSILLLGILKPGVDEKIQDLARIVVQRSCEQSGGIGALRVVLVHRHADAGVL